MAERTAADLAFERAWSIYLLINTGVDENDARRTSLERFIRRQSTLEGDPETLAVAGLRHLKRLDESGDDCSDNHAY